jgi:hypothetical protein
MGADDDADCVEHIWVLGEVSVSGRGADTASTCARCGVPRYEPGQAALRDARPALGDATT